MNIPKSVKVDLPDLPANFAALASDLLGALPPALGNFTDALVKQGFSVENAVVFAAEILTKYASGMLSTAGVVRFAIETQTPAGPAKITFEIDHQRDALAELFKTDLGAN